MNDRLLVLQPKSWIATIHTMKSNTNHTNSLTPSRATIRYCTVFRELPA